jgi:Mor family transcriptional regulator
MKCPKCGYIHPKKPANRPKKFTTEQEKQIVEDRKTMTVKQLSIKWNCCEATINNVIKRNEK